MWQLKWHQLLQAKLPHAASIAKWQRHRSPQFIACCAEHEEHVLQEPGLRYLLVHGWTEGQPISKGMSHEDKTAQLRFFGWHQPATIYMVPSQIPVNKGRMCHLQWEAVLPDPLQLRLGMLNGLLCVHLNPLLGQITGLCLWCTTTTLPRLASYQASLK